MSVQSGAMPDPRVRRSKLPTPRDRRRHGDAPDTLAPSEAASAEAQAAAEAAAAASAEEATLDAASVQDAEAVAVEDAGPDAAPDVVATGESDGWFRDAPLQDGTAATAAPQEAELGLESEAGTFVRERDRPVISPLPAPVSPVAPRRRHRLRGLLTAVAIIVAVAAAGFAAGLLLPTFLPGPGISPDPTPPIAAPTATPSPPGEPTTPPTVVPSATPTPPPTPTPAPTEIVHVVRAGDQLARIAATYGVTVAAIQEANGIRDPNLIRVGQRLIIPSPEATPVP